MDFTGKVVIVTGASSGIGAATARRFSELGATVVLAARTEEKLNEVLRSLKTPGMVVCTDVTQEEACRHLVDETIKAYGKIDILVNNAGISMRALFRNMHLSVLRSVMDVNFWGAVYCTKYALPWILKQQGSVVGVTSIAGFVGLPGRIGYSSSKYALHGFLETLRIEYLEDKLHVLIICPSYTNTNIRRAALNALGQSHGKSDMNENKLVTPESVAQRLVRGVWLKKRTMVLTPLGKATVFFQKWAPRWMDKRVYKRFRKQLKESLSKFNGSGTQNH